MTRSTPQRGAALIAAIFLIVVVAFFGLVVVSLTSTQNLVGLNEFRSTEALFVADGGFERATRALLAPPLAERIACGAITGNANLTNVALGDGQFTVTGDAGTPFYPAVPAWLIAAIGTADTTIAVTTTAGYAPSGRLMIDRELIDYTGIAAVPPRFTGAKRGAGGSTPATHATATRVAQYQCSVTSQGGVTTLAAPTGRRTVAEGIQLEEGWAGGKSNGGGDELFRWNRLAAPNAWGGGSNAAAEIRAIDMVSYADGWAVGKKSVGTYNIARWNGTAWNQVAVVGNQDLEAVSMLSATDGFAVGKKGTILRWNGVVWQSVASGTTEDLKSVSMVAPNDGWIVGTNGTILHWDGATWAPVASPTSQDLEDVFLVSSTAGWIVGKASGGILHWDGATWHRNDAHGLLITTRDLTSLHMVSSSVGWAVGKNGVIYHYLSTANPAWHRGDAHSTSPTGQELSEVFMLSALNGWGVGKGGIIVHWDSANWATVASPTAQDLKGLSMIAPGGPPHAVWREVFN